MGTFLRIEAADGHELSAYHSIPQGEIKGSIVVLQEIFGVNGYIKEVCDRFAKEGYIALAPALFDRQVRDFESGYSSKEVEVARGLMTKLDWAKLLADTEASADYLKGNGPIGVVGFCLGGSIAYMCSTQLKQFDVAVCYYGGMISSNADQVPRVPTQMHFGEKDHTIPISDVKTIIEMRPECDIHVYDAGHGFDCDQRESYEPESARIAWQRTLTWLAESFAKTGKCK